jgi:NhaP-type Na+/H+ or K+/H+ antiporter
VAVILFEGSMTLHFSELKEVGSTVRNLVTIGALEVDPIFRTA